MSLLMDALKRAEEAKRQQGESSAAESGGLRLEPVTPPPSESRNSGLPDLNSHLDAVDADLKATAAEQTPRQPSARKPDENIDRAVAQNVLAAGGNGMKEAEAESSRSRIVAIIGVGALAAAGVGIYFYLQLQGLSQGTNRLAANPGAPLSRPPAPIAGLNPPAATSQAPAGVTAAPPLAVPEPATTNMNAAPGAINTTPPRAASRPSNQDNPVAVTRKASSPKSSSTAKTAARTSGATAASSTTLAGDTVQVSRQSSVSPVIQGYEALQAGNFTEARNAYGQALRQDSRDVDAMLGLAALAQKEGRIDEAGEFYERILQIDPRNGSAVAGLSALQGGTDAGQTESRLKSLINLQNSDPNATSALNFALGNLYAGQRRWPEAQQAYFRAYAADTGNPDVLYNLAISLEHLNQKPLAKQFYGQAVQAGRQRSASFERTEAEKRITALNSQ